MVLIEEVISHLKGDSETWLKLSKKAREEYLSDLKLIEKIKKISEVA